MAEAECGFCEFDARCQEELIHDDYLSQVAYIRRDQARKLEDECGSPLLYRHGRGKGRNPCFAAESAAPGQRKRNRF